MSDERIILQADLRTIENNLGNIRGKLEVLDTGVDTVNSNVKVVYDEIGSLAQEFHDFIGLQIKANRLGQAETRLVKIRQELDKKFGHYDIVRRTTTGILQADDLGIVRRDTISAATEELMISTPGYWLAPCLVALAAWINDQPELAEKAVREGIRRDDEKTSLFFALICRRANRKGSCLKWTQRYLANQDEQDLDRKTIIILDAFASGLLGADSEGLISRQMTEWLDHLSEKEGFVEQQRKQWAEAIELKRKPIDTNSYMYLRKYSSTWPYLEDVLEGANLHAEILKYFMDIFEQESSNESLKEQLDEILTSLVSDYDDEELPLRKEEKFEQFIVDFEGDENRARQNMSIEETAFETHKDFTQLLTDAAMKPESSHSSVSTQKFSIALSKEWISEAYRDITLKNRAKIPADIKIDIESFSDRTADGKNEKELLTKFSNWIDGEKTMALRQYQLSGFEQFCLPGGGVIAVLGLLMALGSTSLLGIIAMVAGIAMVVQHFSAKKRIEENRQKVEEQYREKHRKGAEIIRGILAEVVDFRQEFAEKDAEYQKVEDFLEQITPDQYVKKLSDSNRRIKI